MIRCINITTGQQIWALNAWPVSTSFYSQIGAVAEGYLTFFNEYDGQMYSVGRGPSATTVSAPDIAVPFGSPIVIKGTVTDVSNGAQQATSKSCLSKRITSRIGRKHGFLDEPCLPAIPSTNQLHRRSSNNRCLRL